MGSMSIWHWLVVVLVIVLLFGAKRIPELAKGLGSGIRTFKKELDKEDNTYTATQNKETSSNNIEKKHNVIETHVVDSQATTHNKSEELSTDKMK